ncbi:MAG: deoxyribose-phosphate aldolase [Atopobiaceae bacterium]|jgi:deoxyribose-phosphate aldolase|nr:deoxyribose-phosphate aldolase [Atopobiaceae bacterium]MCH4181222.1 deoxyribose-phosphate aldolase [Atopobiaceae bacterium]MCH4214646.1 deoxyribose-phosphate aldolase [Atopobiaceae bacterium]MCH4230147.1 deoxyribose-phosphate aldolase [Atopobiaceae bacterium]MCH4275759.1 deoxyribose-phosphate aldolase [Atopobiaceae bacterium]
MKPSKKAVQMSERELASYVDQSVLKPEFTVDQIRKYAQEGIDFGCKTICINPASLDIVAPMVEGTKTGICVVCDFPFGLSTTASKVLQAEEYCKNYKIEDLDIVSNYGRLRSGDYGFVTSDIKAVVDVCHAYGSNVKVIIETDSLTIEQVKAGTRCAVEAGADFVKSSTGFFTGGEQHGATNEVVAAMIEAGAGKIRVKGSGAIRTQEHFFELIDMGIDRMGVGYRSTPTVLGCTAAQARDLD